jgi:phosphoglycerol transferase
VAPRYIPNYAAIAQRFDTDAFFYHDVEERLPRGAMVLQLPIAPFPEAGLINDMPDYEQLTAYLQTEDLRWSFGGMRGRPEGDWKNQFKFMEPIEVVATAAASGFEGLVIDRTGFADGGKRLLAAIEPVVGAPSLRTTDDRLLFIDLRDLRAQLDDDLGRTNVDRIGSSSLRRYAEWVGFSYAEPSCGKTSRWAVTPRPSVNLYQDVAPSKRVELAFDINANPDARSVEVSGPGFSDTVELRDGAGSWRRSVALPRGRSTLQFDFDGPPVVAPGDPRGLQFAVSDVTMAEPFDNDVTAWARARAEACKDA